METTTISSRRATWTLLALAISAFAIGITEFIAVGVMPMLMTAFNLKLSTAGLTVSVYAAGIMVGAPLLTAVTTRLPRKQLLLSVMGMFIFGNIVTGIAPGFGWMLVGRVIAAFAHGLFMSTATVIAASVVTENRRSSAIATMFTGLTVATVTGVPLGTMVAQVASWRVAFIAIAGFGVLALLANWALVPTGLPQAERAARGGFKRILSDHQVLAGLVITALGYGASFPVYTYISALLAQLGFAASTRVWLLLGYGVAVAIGNTLGGRWANHKPLQALAWMFGADLVIMLLMLWGLGHVLSGLVLLVLMGLFAFMNVPGLQLFTMQAAEASHPEDAPLASALNIAAFNVGIVFGSSIGGKLLDTFGLQATPFGGALFAALALVITLNLVHKK